MMGGGEVVVGAWALPPNDWEGVGREFTMPLLALPWLSPTLETLSWPLSSWGALGQSFLP